MLTQEKLRLLLDYDRNTGELTWRHRPRSEFRSDRSFNTFNAVYAGKVAGNVDCLDGYRKIGIFGRLYRAHRLAWLYVYGEWPSDEVDHINHDKTDNRISNLRVVTRSENAKNLPLRKDNKTGATGVHRHKSGWTVTVGNTYIGCFRSKSEAISARRKAAGTKFHKNHGKSQSNNSGDFDLDGHFDRMDAAE